MKKELSAIIVSAMILCMGVTAFAGQIQPRALACAECGGDTVRYTHIDHSIAPSTCDICGAKKVNGAFYSYYFVCTNSECGHFEYLQGQFICYDCQ